MFQIPPKPSDFCKNIFDMIDQVCYAMKGIRGSRENRKLHEALKGIKTVLNKRTDTENAISFFYNFKEHMRDHRQATALIHVVEFFKEVLTTTNPIHSEFIALFETNNRLRKLFDNFKKSLREFIAEELEERKKLTEKENYTIEEDRRIFMIRVERYVRQTSKQISEGPSADIPIGRKFEADSSNSADSSDPDAIQNLTIEQLKEENYVLSKGKESKKSNLSSLLMDFKREHFRICGKAISEWAKDYNSSHNDEQISIKDLPKDEKQQEQETILRYAIERMYLGYGKNKIEGNWVCDPETKKQWIEFNETHSFLSAARFYEKLQLIYDQPIFGFALSFLNSAGGCFIPREELKDAEYSNLFLKDGGIICADCFFLFNKVRKPPSPKQTKTISEEKVLEFEIPCIIYSHASYDVNEGDKGAFVLEELKAAGADPNFNRLLRAIIKNKIDEAFEPANIQDFHNAEVISLKHFISVITNVVMRIQIASANLPPEFQLEKRNFYSSFSDKLLRLQYSAKTRLKELGVSDSKPTSDEAEEIRKLFYDRLPCRATKGEKYRVDQEEQVKPRSSSFSDFAKWLGLTRSSTPPLPRRVLQGGEQQRRRAYSTPPSPEKKSQPGVSRDTDLKRSFEWHLTPKF